MRNLFRWLIPFGIVQRRRDHLACQRLGLDPSKSGVLLKAAELARYELWPSELRNASDFFLVDVGANKGQFSFAVRQLVPSARIVAIEPQPSCCATLRSVTQGDELTTVNECAIGSHRAEVNFNVFEDDVASSLLAPRSDIQQHYEGEGMQIAKKVSIQMLPLDAVIPTDQAISLLKIDVQGYEGEVLKGANETLLRTQCVLIEVNYLDHYVGESDFTSLHLALIKLGFKLHGISTPYFSEQRPLWADALYQRC